MSPGNPCVLEVLESEGQGTKIQLLGAQLLRDPGGSGRGKSLGTGRPPFVKRAGPRHHWPQGQIICPTGPGLGGDPYSGPRPKPRCVSRNRGSPAAPGPPRFPDPPGLRRGQPSPQPCPALSGGGGWKPQPKADKEVARKAEAALMVAEGAGSHPVRSGGPGWWPGFLFSPQAPLSSPLLPQGRSWPATRAPTTCARQCDPAPGEPGPRHAHVGWRCGEPAAGRRPCAH